MYNGLKEIYQLIVFIQNKPGCLLKAIKVLFENDIMEWWLRESEHETFGPLRAPIADREIMKSVQTELEKIGFLTQCKKVFVIDSDMALEALETMALNKVNLDYIHCTSDKMYIRVYESSVA